MELLKSFQSSKITTTGATFSSVIFLVAMWSLLYLLFSAPFYTKKEDVRRFSGPCPAVWGERRDWRGPVPVANSSVQPKLGIIEIYRQGMAQQSQQEHVVDCVSVIAGDEAEVDHAKGFNWCRNQRPLDYDYTQMASTSCDKFKDTFAYHDLSVSDEERNFPIAFSILTYEDTHQTERLLNAIYRPQNVYCIHVDAKADSAMLEAINAIAGCLPNVIVPTDSVNVHWAEYSVLEAELTCMRALWDSPVKWKYFINLTGREYPLRTNAELVQILTAYNGANDIDGSMYNRNIDWMKYVWRAENWRTNTLKSPVPHNFNIHKGSAHIVASRAFLEYVLTDEKARDLREWMRDTRLPDEHYFNTLSQNSHFGIPGSYTDDPAMKSFYGRLKLWWQNEDSTCSGEWARYICNLGAQELSSVLKAKHLFVNKVRRDVAPVAYECLAQWHSNRTHAQQLSKSIQNDFDLQFYKDLKIVKNHV